MVSAQNVRSKYIYWSCYCGMIICSVLSLLWLLMASAVAPTPLPQIVKVDSYITIALICAVASYRRVPQLSILISGFNFVPILLGIVPWEAPGLFNFLSQFCLEIIFFLAANIGYFFALPRYRRA
jgi:hypothetical protein